MKKIILGFLLVLLLGNNAYSKSWYNTSFEKTKKGECIKGPKVPNSWTPLDLKKSGFTVTKIKKHLYQASLNNKMMFITKTRTECKKFLNGLNSYIENK